MLHDCQPTILIVDDEEDWRESISLPLESEGYHLEFARNSAQVLEKINGDKPFDIICMNILLRGEVKDGWRLEWTNLLGEAEKRRANVIVITSMNKVPNTNNNQIIEEAKEYGVKAVFFKDEISRNKLLKEIQKIVPISYNMKNYSSFLTEEEKAEIRQLIKKDELEPALVMLESKKILQNQAIGFQGRLTRIKSEHRQSLKTREEAEIERNRIGQAILELISE